VVEEVVGVVVEVVVAALPVCSWLNRQDSDHLAGCSAASLLA